MAETDLAKRLAGRFLVLDGPDGSGKGTQLERLTDWLTSLGVRVCRAQDPGGTPIGMRIREILLDPAASEMSPACETMLYMASRAQLVHEVVLPALHDGQLVLCDRFVSSTVAYQGAAGVKPDDILKVADVAVGHTWPDLTIILDIDAEAGLQRVRREFDRMEAKSVEFHRRVRLQFLQQAERWPARFAVVNAQPDADTVATNLQRLLKERF